MVSPLKRPKSSGQRTVTWEGWLSQPKVEGSAWGATGLGSSLLAIVKRGRWEGGWGSQKRGTNLREDSGRVLSLTWELGFLMWCFFNEMSEGNSANESMMNVQSMSNNKLLIIIQWTSTLQACHGNGGRAYRDPEAVPSTPLFLEGHTLTQTCEDSFLVLKLLDQPVLLFVQINVEKVFLFCVVRPFY